MKKLLLSIVLITTLSSAAQTFQWLKTPPITYALNPDMIAYVNAVDGLGNVYFAGYKENHYNYGSDMLGNLYFNKYDSAGQLLFSNTFGGNGTAYNIKTDSAGNVVMAIGYYTTITIDGLTIASSSSSVQHLIVKFDSDGH